MKKTMLLALVAVSLSLPLMAKAKKVEGVVNLSTATAAELVMLPGIGKAKAEAIVAYRQAHPFKSTSELTEVKGIGPKRIQSLEKYLTLQGPTTLHLVAASPAQAPVVH